MLTLRVVSFSLLAFFSGFSTAGILGIEPYRDAQLVKSNSQTGQFTEIPLGKISRAGSGWEPESVERVEGDLFSSLYKIHRNAVLSDVYSHYRTQMAVDGRMVLFECDSRSCGSSNAWANNFFGDYLLYGPDQSQFLLVVKNPQDIYQVLYINRRGAGDVMVRLDEVKSARANGTEFEIVAQMDVQDIPRIRRFVSVLSADQNLVGFVTSQKTAGLSALESGDQLISIMQAGLGDRFKDRVRFVNLADLGRESLGINRVSFVYVRP